MITQLQEMFNCRDNYVCDRNNKCRKRNTKMIKLLAQLILLADFKNPSKQDWLRYAWNVIRHFAPVAFLLSVLGAWFHDNKQFGTFICTALIINMIVGAIMHFKNRTFKLKLFIWRNIEMAFVIITVYMMLEMLRYTAGDNIAGDVFRILIQTMTLLYPTSKVFKNIFILTKGKYPPEFLMKKLYSFEKSGDLGNLFSGNNSQSNEEINIEDEKD